MIRRMQREYWYAGIALGAAFIIGAVLPGAQAQVGGSLVLDRAHAAVREQIESREGRNLTVRFNNDAVERSISNNQRSVSGTGIAYRGQSGGWGWGQPQGEQRSFYYETWINTVSGAASRTAYTWQGQWTRGGTGTNAYYLGRAQEAVRDEIVSRTGRNAEVFFNNDVRERFISNNETSITGTGRMTNLRVTRAFTYEASVNTRTGTVTNVRYNFTDGGIGGGTGTNDYLYERVQTAVRQDILSRTGRNAEVTFDNDVRERFISNAVISISGTGTILNLRRTRPFSYEATVNTRTGNVTDVRYDFTDGGAGRGTGTNPYYYDRVQGAVRDNIMNSAGRNAEVTFNNDMRERFISNTETGISGTGTLTNLRRARPFSYEATVNTRTGIVTNVRYDFTDGGIGGGAGAGNNNPVFNRTHEAVRAYIKQREGNETQVTFRNDAAERFISNAETGVSGTGYAVIGGQQRNFRYEATVNQRNNNVSQISYEWTSTGGENLGRPTGNVAFRGAIVNRASGKVLDVTGQSMDDAAKIQQWTYARQGNQLWEVIAVAGNQYAIVNQNSGKVLDLAGFSRDDGGQIWQYYWANQPNQKWRLQSDGGGFYRIVSVHSGKCLDVQSKSNADGASIHQWTCDGSASQQWRIEQQ